ncbi:hypothetical protein ABBQ32_002642 [Trebouxia sp. C0010 RCD-2024]
MEAASTKLLQPDQVILVSAACLATVPDWLQNPQQLIKIYAALCGTPQPPTDHPTMGPVACQATYLMGPSRAHALHEQSVATKTLQQRHKNARELADWLHSTNIGRTLHNWQATGPMVGWSVGGCGVPQRAA